MSDELIKRLRNPPFGTETTERNLMTSAADALTAAQEENERLLEALEPFAKVAEHDIGYDETDTDLFRPMTMFNRAPRIRVGDLRTARAALDGLPK